MVASERVCWRSGGATTGQPCHSLLTTRHHHDCPLEPATTRKGSRRWTSCPGPLAHPPLYEATLCPSAPLASGMPVGCKQSCMHGVDSTCHRAHPACEPQPATATSFLCCRGEHLSLRRRPRASPLDGRRTRANARPPEKASPASLSRPGRRPSRCSACS